MQKKRNRVFHHEKRRDTLSTHVNMKYIAIECSWAKENNDRVQQHAHKFNLNIFITQTTNFQQLLT